MDTAGPQGAETPVPPPSPDVQDKGTGLAGHRAKHRAGRTECPTYRGCFLAGAEVFPQRTQTAFGQLPGTVRDPGAEHLHPPLQFPISGRCPHCPELTTGPGAKKPDAVVQPAQPLDTRRRDGDRLGASARCPAQKVTNSEIQMQPMSKLSAGEGKASNLTRAAKIKDEKETM